jgi:putative transposase
MEEANPLLFTTATILEWKHLLKKDEYKQIIVDSLRFCVENKRIKVFGFVIMPNHTHLLWTINPTWKLENVQRDMFKFTAQQFKFDLLKNHPKVLEQFYVGAKDRAYQFWERNPLSIECYTRDVAWQKLNYIHNNPCRKDGI